MRIGSITTHSPNKNSWQKSNHGAGMGVEGASRVGMANRRFQKPRRNRWLSAGSERKVESMWLVCGAAKLRWSRRSVVWQAWHGARGSGGAKDHQAGRADGFLCLLRRVNGPQDQGGKE